MTYEKLKSKFPEEGRLCKTLCGKCCVSGTIIEQSEADSICDWLIKNKDVDSIKAQFHHFDDHPKQCPFLTPEKTCFVYPVRPVACVMFGHLPDIPGAPKRLSQQCPEGVAFTQVSIIDTLPESMVWHDRAQMAMGRMLNFRSMKIIDDDGTEIHIAPKPGSIFEKMMNARSCFRCSAEAPNGGTLYFHGDELLCAICSEKESLSAAESD